MDTTEPIRKKPVAWFAPGQLAGTALRVLLAQRFGAYLDKRELQAMFEQPTFRHDSEELWLDYVADVGDGFDSTYSIAYLLAQPGLDLTHPESDAETTLPRGQVLVMGGDQVYPVGSAVAYRERCEGPYSTAFPDSDDDGADLRAPALYALPGNHDWYDGLTAFLRLFGKGRHFGGWRSPQSRSYFALKLPHGWWLYAIDEQFDAYLDEPQMDYFRAAAKELKPGDRVIIASPAPSWVYTEEKPSEYDTIRYFIKKIIGDRDVRVKLHLSGDAHHYARYGDGFITCGGGGAYLAGTHGLPKGIAVPVVGAAAVHPLRTTYPSKEDSKRYGWGVFWRMPLRNPTFALLIGLLHTLVLLAFVSSKPRILTLPVIGIVTIAFAATVGFSTLEARVIRKRHWAAGFLHGCGHLTLAIAGMILWNRLPFVHLDPPWGSASTLLYLPVASLLGVQIVAAYLLIADRFGVNRNELFSGQGIIDSKSFLRMKFAKDGSLTIYPIGLERSGRAWQPNTGPGPSLLEPAEPLEPHLIEAPIVLS
ncbi:metallophosphoesterase [Longispora sp. K20-0274]|uniref:metallophosphoesterase n=1 Tax=Longispora sp. K20-0274 TaxID=3088255 RepID=UPI00399C3144